MKVIYFCFIIWLCKRTFESLQGNSKEVPDLGRGPNGTRAPQLAHPLGIKPSLTFCSNCIFQLLSGKDSRIMISGKWELLLFSLYVVSDVLWPHGLPCTRLPCPSLSPRVSSLISTELVMPSNHLILCHSLLILPSIFPSSRLFSNELFTSGAQSIGASSSAIGKVG